jgi:hypothetical protein
VPCRKINGLQEITVSHVKFLDNEQFCLPINVHLDGHVETAEKPGGLKNQLQHRVNGLNRLAIVVEPCARYKQRAAFSIRAFLEAGYGARAR